MNAFEDQLEAMTVDIEERLTRRFPLHTPSVSYEVWDPDDGSKPMYSLQIEVPTGREADWFARIVLPPPDQLRAMKFDYVEYIAESVAYHFETVAANLN